LAVADFLAYAPDVDRLRRDMSLANANPPARGPALPPFLPLLLVLFVGSGAAALIYEIVWLQLLQLVIGSTAVSLGVLLGTFMGGMCLGSLLLPRLVSGGRHPLRVYGLLELGIGALGLAIVNGMPLIEGLYVQFAGHGFAGILLRGAVAGLCLLPPTLLMGATLPAVARYVETSREGVSWLGFFYGGNIAGAVLGCLAAGFYLLRVYDMPTATYAACAVNVIVATVALALSAAAPYQEPAGPAPEAGAAGRPGRWAVYVTIALSGAAALGAEVTWTRLLSLLLGGTVYTFSNILAVFLVGLGIGSTLGAMVARTTASPRRALGFCQVLLIAAIAWTALTVSESLPWWPVNPSLLHANSPWYTFQLDLARCLWAVLPPACLWGASFPLALGAVASRGQDGGRLVGGVYAANTVGAIAGALAFSLLVIPQLGTLGAQRLLLGLSALAALAALGPLLWRRQEAGWGVAAGLAGALVLAAVLAWRLTPVPWEMVAFGRQIMVPPGPLVPGITRDRDIPFGEPGSEIYCTYVGEGMNVSVAVTRSKSGVRSFHGAGKVQASTLPQDMRLQRMLGHLSALAHPKPEKVLVVACGAGVTAGSFVVHPEVRRIVICDIEPLVPTTVTPMFGPENYYVVDGIADENPRLVRRPGDPHDQKEVEVVYDDGRHFVRTTQEKFDVITSDPIDPWVKGCAALNTVEYYEMCKEHLTDGGVMALWMPLYESNLETTKSVIATFFQVFPNGILWSNDTRGVGYDAVLFGMKQDGPAVFDVDALQARLDRPDHRDVKKSLEEVGFGAPSSVGIRAPGRGVAVDLLATYAGRAADLGEWSRGAQINTDRNLRLQYLAGLSLNHYMGEQILGSILEHYRFPDDRTFVGSAARLQALRSALEEAGRKRRARPGS
jgi:spermidine synthase